MKTANTHVAHFIGNDLALDFVNSAFGTGEAYHDCLVDDAGVVDWLKAAGQLPSDFDLPPAGLAELARTLRQAATQLIGEAKAGRRADPAVVNHILEVGQPIKTLKLDAQAGFVLSERRRDDSAASLLQPVALALARLLASGDLTQVRACEAHDCTLQFLDTTKSGRRRWCSMAVCGNRMKVAAFRSRKEAP